jgi:peptide/nickel transport system permease protein
MLGYIVRRLGILVVILLGSSFILFNLAAISSDPLEALKLSGEQNVEFLIAALTQELRLDLIPPLRYFVWLEGVLGAFTGNFDLGMTRDGQKVLTELAVAVPITIRLVLASTILAIILGIAVGIVSALRQYSRFDYSTTFVAFLMFSLPVFWVAVLLKEYIAIAFNNFLSAPNMSIAWILIVASVIGIFWAGVISGNRKRIWLVFGIALIGSAGLLYFLNLIDWFLSPTLGIFVVFFLSIGIAFGITQLSMGIDNKSALYGSLAVAVFGAAAYFPINSLFDDVAGFARFTLIGLVFVVISGLIGLGFAKIDRGPIVRTTSLTGFVIYLLITYDKYLQTWYDYIRLGAIEYRPIPTVSQSNSLLQFEDNITYWVRSLDILVHLILPTMALTLISFAGYIRYARGTMLEVLNQDYIRTARAKGLNERTVIMRHAFRNTMIPITTIMVVDFAGVVGGAIITERVFGWTGMGTLFNKAITTYDLNLLMGVFLVTGFLAVFANLVADLLYSLLDPRIRVGAGK